MAAVREACPPDGPDVVIEVCGVPAVLPAGLAMLRKGGRYVVAGIVFPQANVTLDANTILSKWITMRGNHNYHPRHLVQALDFVARNRTTLPFRDIVDSRFDYRGPGHGLCARRGSPRAARGHRAVVLEGAGPTPNSLPSGKGLLIAAMTSSFLTRGGAGG